MRPHLVLTASGHRLDKSLPQVVVYLLQQIGRPARAADLRALFEKKWPSLHVSSWSWGATLSQAHAAGLIDRVAWGLYRAKDDSTASH